MIVAAAHDGALAPVRHDEGERGFRDLPVMDRDAVFGRHVDEHAAEPVVGDRGQEIGHDPELGAAEGRRHRVAAERDRIVPRHRLLVAGRQFVRKEGHVDIRLAYEQCLHRAATRTNWGEAPGPETPGPNLCSTAPPGSIVAQGISRGEPWPYDSRVTCGRRHPLGARCRPRPDRGRIGPRSG